MAKKKKVIVVRKKAAKRASSRERATTAKQETSPRNAGSSSVLYVNKEFKKQYNKLQKTDKVRAYEAARKLLVNQLDVGLNYEDLKLGKKNFWSARVTQAIRIITHEDFEYQVRMLCYVDQHDPAYKWAKRNNPKEHPITRALQIVPEDSELTGYVMELDEPGPRLFDLPEDQIMKLGVPPALVHQVESCRTLDRFYNFVALRLPEEARNELLRILDGNKPRKAHQIGEKENPYNHKDSQVRFKKVKDADELHRVLTREDWMDFLDSDQKSLSEKEHSGVSKVSGSAGTGKTSVALHRTVHLAQNNPETSVLVVTFSGTLRNELLRLLRELIGHEKSVHERIKVHSAHSIGEKLHIELFKHAKIATEEQIRSFIREGVSLYQKQKKGMHFSEDFLWTEWRDIIDDLQLKTPEAYRSVERRGRKKQLTERQREAIWPIFEHIRSELKAHKPKLITKPGMFENLTEHLLQTGEKHFDYAVVDEFQDLGRSELLFIRALVGNRSEAMFLVGDAGQRIVRSPYSLKELGLDTRGRSAVLKVDYRSSNQIRAWAGRLSEPEMEDVDGNVEDRKGTVSAFFGPPPEAQVFSSQQEELAYVVKTLKEWRNEGIAPEDMAICVRSESELPRAEAAARGAGIGAYKQNPTSARPRGKLSLVPMDLAKGLEFRAVVVMACDQDVIPQPQLLEGTTDSKYISDVKSAERRRMYVACTRARERLLVTGVAPESEFLSILLAPPF